MIDWLTLGGALLSGLLGSVHCGLMCGGIATGIAMGFPREQALAAALRLNLGRVASYAVAGALVGAFGGGLLGLFRWESLQLGMRMGVGAVLMLAALRILLPGRLTAAGRPGQWLWRRLQPLRSRLLPANTAPRQLVMGMLWGWLPCGLSATLLGAAWLSADPLQGALLMATFGFGTWLSMLPLSWSGSRAGGLLQQPKARAVGGTLLLLMGALTVAAPWLAQVPALHRALSVLGCRSLG